MTASHEKKGREDIRLDVENLSERGEQLHDLLGVLAFQQGE
jgi:hypothetical protein